MTSTTVEYVRKELCNGRLIRDVKNCRHRGYEGFHRSATVALSAKLGVVERRVLQRFRKEQHGQATPRWANVLIFGRLGGIRVPSECYALVRLVRRGLVKAYEVYSHQNGNQYLWECQTEQQELLMSQLLQWLKDRRNTLAQAPSYDCKEYKAIYDAVVAGTATNNQALDYLLSPVTQARLNASGAGIDEWSHLVMSLQEAK